MPDPLRQNRNLYQRPKGARTRTSRSGYAGRDDARWDRDARMGRTSDEYGPGLTVNTEGRIVPKLAADSALYVRADGFLDVRVAGGLEVSPGSPAAIRPKLGPALEVNAEGAIEVNPINVSRLRQTLNQQAARITALEALTTAQAAALAALTDRVTAIETDAAYLDASTGAFTAAIGGVTPTDDAHLATKAYVDAAVAP